MTKSKTVLIAVSLITFLLGLLAGSLFHQDNPIAFTETRQHGQYKLINPLLECDAANFSQDASLNKLRTQITDKIDQLAHDQKITFASVYYRDLNNGPWMGINEKENFSPASLVKVPVMMAYFKAAEKNPDLLNQTIKSLPTTVDNQNIDPAITLAPNKSYTVNDLIERMIIYSDNEAYDLLGQYIENDLIVKTYTDLGIDISKGFTDPTGNIISVRDYASFFRVLFNASYLNKDMSEKALDLLTKVEYKDGLIKGINNQKVTIAHKFGEREYIETGEKQLHDCGIVYLPNKPFLICIMTRGNDLTKMSTAINQISSAIYQSVSSKN